MKWEWIDLKDRVPTVDDSDLFGHVLLATGSRIGLMSPEQVRGHSGKWAKTGLPAVLLDLLPADEAPRYMPDSLLRELQRVESTGGTSFPVQGVRVLHDELREAAQKLEIPPESRAEIKIALERKNSDDKRAAMVEEAKRRALEFLGETLEAANKVEAPEPEDSLPNPTRWLIKNQVKRSIAAMEESLRAAKVALLTLEGK